MTEKPEPEVTKILQDYRVVAVVGLSSDPGRPSYQGKIEIFPWRVFLEDLWSGKIIR